jgi:hypothetical protein
MEPSEQVMRARIDSLVDWLDPNEAACGRTLTRGEAQEALMWLRTQYERAALQASGDAIDARRRCGHCLGNTRWCPECALNERLSNDDIHELAMHSTLLECIDDAYQERGDWLPHVRSFALDVLNAALGNPTSSPKSDVDMRASIKAPSEFCWLVELFEPGGNSMGLYHTGFTELDGMTSRTTSDPHKAKRYATKEAALASVDKLLSKAGVWRAIEHGFHGAGK